MTPSALAKADQKAIDPIFFRDVIEGLSRPQKSLPSRYFYDDVGSSLFEAITKLPEYYLTRAETRILAAHARDIVKSPPADVILLEFGSGSSLKTELLIDELPKTAHYMPIDVSEGALANAVTRLSHHYPELRVIPIIADFMTMDRLPRKISSRPKLGFFPGSTIGNFNPEDARRLLQRLKSLLRPHSRLIIGVDMKKDRARLEEAYNDRAGVTAEFNLNLLARINREIAPAFDLEAFNHKAFFNEEAGRIEMHLVSTRAQHIDLLGHAITFAADETIHTENSYKHSLAEFRELAASSGWRSNRTWTDEQGLFSVHELI